MNKIDHWIPQQVQQQVVECVKSGVYSFTACIIVTRGDVSAAAASAAFAVLACVIHVVCQIIVKNLQTQSAISAFQPPKKSSRGNELFVFSGVVTVWTMQKLGYNCHVITSLVASLISYDPPSRRKSPGISPMFGIIVYQVRLAV